MSHVRGAHALPERVARPEPVVVPLAPSAVTAELFAAMSAAARSQLFEADPGRYRALRDGTDPATT